MKYLMLSLIVLNVCGCTVFRHDRVNRNSKTFIKCLNIVSNYEEGKKEVLENEYNESTLFLSLATGINSKAGYSNTVGYKNKGEYQDDMTQWKLWYQGNKTKLTDKYIDSAYRRVGLTPPDILRRKK